MQILVTASHLFAGALAALRGPPGKDGKFTFCCDIESIASCNTFCHLLLCVLSVSYSV